MKIVTLGHAEMTIEEYIQFLGYKLFFYKQVNHPDIDIVKIQIQELQKQYSVGIEY